MDLDHQPDKNISNIIQLDGNDSTLLSSSESVFDASLSSTDVKNDFSSSESLVSIGENEVLIWR